LGPKAAKSLDFGQILPVGHHLKQALGAGFCCRRLIQKSLEMA
jgi:hypothetical protein